MDRPRILTHPYLWLSSIKSAGQALNTNLYQPMKCHIYYMSIGLFLTTLPIIAQEVFEVDGLRYEVMDSVQHTAEIKSARHCGITESYDRGNTINVVRIKSSVQNNGTTYRVVAIQDSAFARRTDIDRLVIENGIVGIGSNAFAHCKYMEEVSLPSTVIDIAHAAFSGCDRLCRINVAQGNEVYDSRNNCNAVIETGTRTLRIACSGTVIPNDIVAIGEGAFSGMNTATSLHIPDNIKEIGNGAFRNCGNLRNLYVDASKVIFGQYCFAGCQALETVLLQTGISVIPYGMFKDCGNLTDIDIPYGCHVIESSAFENCRNLRSITIPSDAIMSGGNQFKGCMNAEQF